MIDYTDTINKAMYDCLPSKDCIEKKLIEAMEYSISAGGKRVRPSLTLEFCKVCGGGVAAALPFACGVELIHTYSLIHDDLPCMDDDDYRRGRKANHIVYGEDTALLAGDAMQSLAFELMLSSSAVAAVGAENAAKAAFTLAKYCGAEGMVGGQVIDLFYEGKSASIEILNEKDCKKTGALIKAACEMGCIAAGAADSQVKAAKKFGANIGLAFQIVDDILDITSTTQQLGKPTGSDIENHKSTYVSLLGMEKCRKLVEELTSDAIASLQVFEGDTSDLEAFALSLAERNY